MKKNIIVILLLLIGGFYLAANWGNIKNNIEPPKISIMKNVGSGYLDGLDFKIKIRTIVQNWGGNGKVKLAYYVNQNGNRYTKYHVLFLEAGEMTEINIVFDDVKMYEGDWSFETDILYQKN